MTAKIYYKADMRYHHTNTHIVYKPKVEKVSLEVHEMFGEEVYILKETSKPEDSYTRPLTKEEFEDYAREYLFDSKEKALSFANKHILKEIKEEIKEQHSTIKRLNQELKLAEKLLNTYEKQKNAILNPKKA